MQDTKKTSATIADVRYVPLHAAGVFRSSNKSFKSSARGNNVSIGIPKACDMARFMDIRGLLTTPVSILDMACPDVFLPRIFVTFSANSSCDNPLMYLSRRSLLLGTCPGFNLARRISITSILIILLANLISIIVHRIEKSKLSYTFIGLITCYDYVIVKTYHVASMLVSKEAKRRTIAPKSNARSNRP